MFGVPLNTLPIVTYGYFATGYYCDRTCHSKQFSVVLIVLSDGLVYILRFKKKCCRIHQNYLVALMKPCRICNQFISTVENNVIEKKIRLHVNFCTSIKVYILYMFNGFFLA